MSETMSSRQRLMAALSGGEPDHVPLSFMIFGALRNRCRDPFDFFERQVDLGLDTVVDLMGLCRDSGAGHGDAPGLPLRFGPDVQLKQWREQPPGARYPVLHKQYVTPAGTLTCSVDQTDDWPYGDEVPFLDDFLAPRSQKHLVTCREDLPALRHLLKPPSPEGVEELRPLWQQAKELAADQDLLVSAGWGVGADALAWFCGLENAVLLAIDQPALMAELLAVIDEWNRARMTIFLEEGVDLFIRRAWYEGTDFWSPALFREFFFPILKREVEMAHQAGTKFGYILTSGVMPMLDILLELEIDVLIGVDPVQGKATDLAALRERTTGKMCLWGGVNGFITVERGSPAEIREAIAQALEILSPKGGFILSPVDNVRDPSDEVWQNTLSFIEAWKELR